MWMELEDTRLCEITKDERIEKRSNPRSEPANTESWRHQEQPTKVVAKMKPLMRKWKTKNQENMGFWRSSEENI